MLSRRILRVKVMQVIYAAHVDGDVPFSAAKKQLHSYIGKSERLYSYFIYCIGQVARFIYDDMRIVEDKFMPSEAVNSAFLNNNFIKAILEDEKFNKWIKREKLDFLLEEDIVKKTYYKLKESQRYKEYIAMEDKTEQDERKMVIYTIKKVLLKSNLYKSHVDDLFINWTDDRELIINLVLELFNKLPYEEGTQVSDHMVKLSEIETREFSETLLKQSLLNSDEYDEMIKPKLKNWDPDRVTKIDLILMKMAIAELIHFETIPIKVSLNEYLDISKKYSTPKSKDFINGVLDKILKDLKDKGQINKTGRGLLEN